jgi:photosystem II stability/assembly factor-like uncharacterized protein
MKNNLLLVFTMFLILFLTQTSFAQWQSHGPYGGSMHSLVNLGSYTFTGTNNGVFRTSDNGYSWTAANSGIQRKSVGCLAGMGNNLYAGTNNNGIFMSTDFGVTWAQSNTGLLDTNIISLFSTNIGLFAGTSTGVFYSTNGQSWTLANNGIPSTYPIYSFAKSDSTIFGGTYGLGLYSTIDSGANWTSVGGGFPTNSFVYALISDTTTLFAGTSIGVYKSTDGGNTWSPANTGFPSGMWAKSFAITPGYIFAGTYSSGVLLSSDSGNTWASVNNGLPNLPLATGLPTNYPSVQSLIVSGPNVLAATDFGMYLKSTTGAFWMESNPGILATNVTSIATNNSLLIAGTAGTGIYISTDAGNNWAMSFNGLSNENVLAVATTNSWSFTSVVNSKVFRSNNSGSTWALASNGLAASVESFKPDTTRIVALTQGEQFTPPAIYQTVDNGLHWTTIPDSGLSYLSAIGLLNQNIYAGTDIGELYVTNNDGLSWQNISSNLPNSKITCILPTVGTLCVGTQTMGIYMSVNNGGSWTQTNSGITHLNITDIRLQAGVLYASTLGGGVFYSSNLGTTWTAFNSGLDDLYVSQLAGEAVSLYAATDAGVYSNIAIINGIQNISNNSMILYPNPSTGKIYIKNLSNENTQLNIYNAIGEVVYKKEKISENNFTIDLSYPAAGIYFVEVWSEKQSFVKKIVLEKE